jgi:hypothetical protein
LFTLFTILIYPIVFRVPEWRYLVMIFPLLLMLGVILARAIMLRFRKRGTVQAV